MICITRLLKGDTQTFQLTGIAELIWKETNKIQVRVTMVTIDIEGKDRTKYVSPEGSTCHQKDEVEKKLKLERKLQGDKVMDWPGKLACFAGIAAAASAQVAT